MKKLNEFLHHSNLIEGVDADLEDALTAWQVLKDKTVLTEDLLLKVHYKLMQNFEPIIHFRAGKFRDCNVRVGAWRAPAWFEVPKRIQKWLYEINNTDMEAVDDETKEKIIKQMHVDFEQVHPFIDGNGRVGRIILNWQRVNAGLPILVIHEGDEQMEYYKWFQA